MITEVHCTTGPAQCGRSVLEGKLRLTMGLSHPTQERGGTPSNFPFLEMPKYFFFEEMGAELQRKLTAILLLNLNHPEDTQLCNIIWWSNKCNTSSA